MTRSVMLTVVAMASVCCQASADNPIRGKYVEARTCQVYTGPCFANGEVGSTGKNAILVWKIDRGGFAGTDLSARSVAVIVKTSHTLGFNGFNDAKTKKAIVVVDDQADEAQSAALESFALRQTGLDHSDVQAVQRSRMDFQFDVERVTATVSIGSTARIQARKARKGDCICSNESAYYPPLTELLGFVPGVTVEGDVSARRLGTRWSIPDSRSAYLGMFSVDPTQAQLAAKL